ncbi:hypothetical protein [Pararhizobium sp.]|uniref:hypothetical protein n=1 Tax=Pararhizobium sp. TaxID=1977563 RepID=UPI00271F5E1D|nr:hypothetical protein [Pararhizobium sp.]MDO9417006.1 hypothetical protein [Pararhizobium sp.]
MSVKLTIQGKCLAILEKEAERMNTTPTVLARAIIETVVEENIVQETLAGVDLKPFVERKAGRAFGKGCHRFQGKLMSIAGISRITGVPADVIQGRLNRGWQLDRAATEPKQARGFPKATKGGAL